jgi:hypothetical protein
LTQFIADENIPLETVDLLKQQSVDIVSVSQFSAGLSDRKLLETAKDKERILVTFDRFWPACIQREA